MDYWVEELHKRTIIYYLVLEKLTNTLKQELNGTKAYEETSIDEKSAIATQMKYLIKVIEKQLTGTGAIKRQIPLLKPKREINKYYK